MAYDVPLDRGLYVFLYIVNFLTVSRLPNATVIMIHKLIAFCEFLSWAGNSLDLVYFQRFSEQKPTMNETKTDLFDEIP